MSPTDRLLIVVLACLSLAATPVALAREGRPGRASETVVIEGPAGTSRMPLREDEVVAIDGAHGLVTVQTLGGAVRVVQAECPDRTCVKSGWVSTSGSAIVCLPNGVTVRIGGARDDGLDAVVR